MRNDQKPNRVVVRSLVGGLLLVGVAATSLLAPASQDSAPPTAANRVDFNRDVRPILSEHCFNCHGVDAKNRKGGLRLDDRAAALKGGKTDGAAIVPGQPSRSALIKRVTSHDADEVMPPPRVKNPVDRAQIETLKKWIEQGAEYSNHWAFESPRKERVPAGEHPVDFFVKRKLATLKIPPSRPAEPEVLCRRMHLDLVGLPPTPEKVREFSAACRENRSKAIVGLLKSLLASPSFGERWARLWLDLARYADSNGYEKDLLRELWAWRNWVIQAFNGDMPYDQFLVEQLAGDLLPNPTQDQIIATAFLRNSMINEEGAIVPEQFRMVEMFDRMDCLSKATLGLSLQCAQCHSHKFDPISQDEYYGLFSFLNNTYEAQSWVYDAEQQAQIAEIRKNVAAAEDRLKKANSGWETAMQEWQKAVLAKEADWRPLKAELLESTSGLNHPTQTSDLRILTQGHPTTRDTVYFVFTPELTGVTGLRLEALAHADMPFGGPGRSKFGTWAVSELKVQTQTPGSTKWEPVKLVKATADFSEPDGKIEDDWKAGFDKAGKRSRGPVSYLIDGDSMTAWRADRGPGRRNQDSVAVVQFEQPLTLPAKTKLKILLVQDHGGDDNRANTQLGSCRLSLTKSPDPQAQPIDYAAIRAMQVSPEKRTPAQKDAIFAAWRTSLSDAKEINETIAAEWRKHPIGHTSILHLAERAANDVRPTKALDRGEWDRPRHAVTPHVPKSLHPLEAANPTRLDLARWLVSDRSPLAARVEVNRTWQAIFGTGLVETAEDFGTRAPVPEYLDLLDWLAVDFMEHKWSRKHLIETIVTSQTYQQSSALTPLLRERDPKNRLLARGGRFRMDAEVIRDSTLSVAGLLHAKEIGGPSVFPPVPQSVLDYNFSRPNWTPSEGPERYRRALYVIRKRSMPDPVMANFDAPNGDIACVRRARSNTPLSALTSLNETIFVEAAQALAIRILKDGGKDDAARIGYAFELCTSRLAKPAEQEQIAKLLALSRDRLAKGELKASAIAFSKFSRVENLPPAATPNDIAAWTIASRVLLNLDETLTRP